MTETKEKRLRQTAAQLMQPRTILDALRQADRVAIAGLIIANLIPIVLALIFGWHVGDVAMFYWWENIVIGGYSALRILLASGGGPALGMTKFFLIPFFCFHYFFFCFIHVIFLRVLLFEDGMDGPPLLLEGDFFGGLAELVPEGGVIGLLGLVISHGISFYRNYIARGEYKRAIPMLEMFRPYGRIVLLHVCILIGGFAVFLLGSPIIMVVLLMIGKTILDLASHAMLHLFSREGLSAYAQLREQILDQQ